MLQKLDFGLGFSGKSAKICAIENCTFIPGHGRLRGDLKII
jgi:hypothetical protein